MLAAAIESAGSADAAMVGHALSGASFDRRALGGLHSGVMKAADHQFQQLLVVSAMDRVGASGVVRDVEGSGFGFRTVLRFEADEVDTSHRCKMPRSD